METSLPTDSADSLPEGYVVGDLDEIPDGSARVLHLLVGERRVPLLVLRSGLHCLGYLNKCPHFGMPLSETNTHLIFEPNLWVKCNVHYARFRWSDGYCEAGDCEGEYLTRVALTVLSGKVVTGAPR